MGLHCTWKKKKRRAQSSGGAREGKDLLKIYVYFGYDKAAGM